MSCELTWNNVELEQKNPHQPFCKNSYDASPHELLRRDMNFWQQ